MEVKANELRLEKGITSEQAKYINTIFEHNNSIIDPYELIIDNKKYVISREENSNLIVTEIDGVLELIGAVFDENEELIGYTKGTNVYSVFLDKEYPHAEKLDVLTKKIYQIQYGPFNGKKEGLFVHYTQLALDNKKSMKMQYDASNFTDNNIYLYIKYLNNHSPYFVGVKNNIISHNYHISELNTKEVYCPAIVLLDIPVFINRLFAYDIDQIIPKEFTKEAPTELLELFNKENNDYNNIQTVTDVYKRVLKR